MIKFKNLVSGEATVTAITGSKTQETLMEMKKMMDAYLDATLGNEKEGTGTCRMCGKHYDNNAYPIVVDEKCCDDCNMMVAEMNWWLSINNIVLFCVHAYAVYFFHIKHGDVECIAADGLSRGACNTFSYFVILIFKRTVNLTVIVIVCDTAKMSQKSLY